MTNRLRASTLTVLAATVLVFSATHAGYAGGRSDWSGYAWQQIKISACTPTSAGLDCPLYHQKWDWKRNQWVDITMLLDPATGRVSLTQRLTNSDKRDYDHVCVTALIVDADGKDLIAHHQNWNMSSGEFMEDSFTYAAPALREATTIHIGSKQCRQGASQDDATYARVLAAIGP